MNFDELVRDSVQQVLAETHTETPAPVVSQPPASQPITVTIQGQQVTFRDNADLEAQLNATATAIASQRAAPAPQPQVTGGRVANDDDGPAFSNDEYIKLMNEDPRKATNYAMSHMMFDGKVDDAASLIRETLVNQAAQSRQLAAYQFRDSHRDVPIEDPRVGNTIEAIRTELQLPFNAQGLEAAYIYGVNKGRLPDFRALANQNAAAAQNQQQQQYQQPQQQQQFYPPTYQNPQPQYLQGPPNPGRSTSAQIPISVGDIEDMSTDQLASLIRKLNAAGVS